MFSRIGGLVLATAITGCSAPPATHDAAADDALDARAADDAGDANPADATPGDASSDGSVDAAPGPFDLPVVIDDEAIRRIDPTTLPTSATACRAPVLMRVTRVTDGDTMTVADLDSTTTERVRMIGVDTPEVAHSSTETDECYGPEARTFTEQLTGHLVWLTFDGLCYDPYGRTLAYVHIAATPEGFWERQLLRRGLAPAFIIGRNRAFESMLLEDEQIARVERRGLWGACPMP